MKSLLLFGENIDIDPDSIVDGTNPSGRPFDRIYYFREVQFDPEAWPFFFDFVGKEKIPFELFSCIDTSSRIDLCETKCTFDLVNEAKIVGAYQFVSYNIEVSRGDLIIFDGEALIKTPDFSEQSDVDTIQGYIHDFYPKSERPEFSIFVDQFHPRCCDWLEWNNRQGQKAIRDRKTGDPVAKLWINSH